jgi:uncharacterized protein
MVKHKAQRYKWMNVASSTTRQRTGRRLLTQLIVLPILAYQYLIAPLIAGCCRFYPCCSTYAKEVIMKHGATRGIWLSIKRLARCHPWGGNGHDPVP